MSRWDSYERGCEVHFPAWTFLGKVYDFKQFKAGHAPEHYGENQDIDNGKGRHD